MRYYFGEFDFDTERAELRRGTTPVPLEPRAVEVLNFLLERHGQLVRKEELLRGVWKGTRVDEAAIRRAIRAIRRALGEEDGQENFIETRHGVGYTFVAEVRDSPPATPTPPAPAFPEVRPENAAHVPGSAPYSWLHTASALSVRSVRSFGKGRRAGFVSEPARPMFLDASFAIALLRRDHPLHLRALELAEQVQSESRQLVTTESVVEHIRETLQREGFADEADRWSSALAADPSIRVLPVTDQLFAEVMRRYWHAAKEGFGADDCVAFTIMDLYEATEALTDNVNFDTAGFRALLREPGRQVPGSFRTRSRMHEIWLHVVPLLSVAVIVLLALYARTSGDQQPLFRTIEEQPAATVGVPLAAVIALYVTLFFQALRGESIVLDLPGLRLSGAAGSLFAWLISFVVVIVGIAVLWGRP